MQPAFRLRQIQQFIQFIQGTKAPIQRESWNRLDPSYREILGSWVVCTVDQAGAKDGRGRATTRHRENLAAAREGPRFMEANAPLPANRSPIGWPVRRFWLYAAAIVLAAFAARMVAAAWWQSRLSTPHAFAFADSETYWSLAGTIRRGEPFQYGSPDASVFRTPGYPALLAIVFAWAGSDNPPALAARTLSALCGAAATALVIGLGARWHSPAAGLLAGMLAAVHPEAISLGVFVLSEAPFHPLMVLNVWCFHEAFARCDSRRQRWPQTTGSDDGRDAGRSARFVIGLLAGLTAGLAALMRPSWLLFPPFMLGLKMVFDLIALLRARAGDGSGNSPQTVGIAGLEESPTGRMGRATAGGVAAGGDAVGGVAAGGVAMIWQVMTGVAGLGLPVILGVILTMAPWWWRNYRVVGEFVPTTLQVGASLYDGWRPDAEGGSDMRFAPRFFDELKREDAARMEIDSNQPADQRSEPTAGTFESRLDRRQRDAAVAWARANPWRVLELAGIKVARMWSPVPNARDMGGALFRAVIAVGFVPLMGLAVWQTWRRRRDWRTIWPLWAPAIYLTCLHTVFVSSLRYRQPALLPLMTLAAAAVAEGAAKWLRSRRRERDA